MKKGLLSVPTMWADHHVARVVEALQKLPGVGKVAASAARWQVVVELDPAVTSVAAVEKALREAGRPPGSAQEV